MRRRSWPGSSAPSSRRRPLRNQRRALARLAVARSAEAAGSADLTVALRADPVRARLSSAGRRPRWPTVVGGCPRERACEQCRRSTAPTRSRRRRLARRRAETCRLAHAKPTGRGDWFGAVERERTRAPTTAGGLRRVGREAAVVARFVGSGLRFGGPHSRPPRRPGPRLALQRRPPAGPLRTIARSLDLEILPEVLPEFLREVGPPEREVDDRLEEPELVARVVSDALHLARVDRPVL